MASAAEKRLYTPEEYLALEREAETKSEYLNGEIFAMSGVSKEHNRITADLSRALGNRLEGGPCEAFVADMRVKVSRTGLYTYPNVAIVCGEARFEDEEVDTLLHPTVVFEILSPSTERYDRGKKFAHYQRVESLREYVLVSQDEVLAERYVRQGDGWLMNAYRRREDVLPLVSVNIEVPLREVYARVDVPDSETGLPGETEPMPGNPR